MGDGKISEVKHYMNSNNVTLPDIGTKENCENKAMKKMYESMLKMHKKWENNKGMCKCVGCKCGMSKYMKEKDFEKMIKKMQKYMADDVEVFSPFFNITGKDKVMSTMKSLMTYMKENNLQMDGLESKFIPLKDGFITLSEYQVKMDNTNTDDTDTTNNNIDIDTEAKKDKFTQMREKMKMTMKCAKMCAKSKGERTNGCTCNMNEGEGGEEGGEEQQGDSVTIKRADVVLVDEDDKIKQSFSFLDLPKGPQSAGLLREFEKIKSYLKENQGDDAD